MATFSNSNPLKVSGGGWFYGERLSGTTDVLNLVTCTADEYAELYIHRIEKGANGVLNLQINSVAAVTISGGSKVIGSILTEADTDLKVQTLKYIVGPSQSAAFFQSGTLGTSSSNITYSFVKFRNSLS